MGYKLFLDDMRNPVHCITYMRYRIGRRIPIYLENDWVICRNFICFKNTIEQMGLPEFISFDHDLADEHYYSMPKSLLSDSDDIDYNNFKEKTGYDCAKWLVNYCVDYKLRLPEYAIHSMNLVGAENIAKYLHNAKIWLNSQ